MIPKDPFMLLSYINTQLRDNYPSLEELASSLDISQDEVIEKLGKAGYVYSEELNKFVNK
ncbi:MAG: DUF4250 domain-containing protein [Firmicutes bacterium]|nr:DUF4250 domain-containing protein [Bacillota bacterium]